MGWHVTKQTQGIAKEDEMKLIVDGREYQVINENDWQVNGNVLVLSFKQARALCNVLTILPVDDSMDEDG